MTKQQRIWPSGQVIAALRAGVAIPDSDLVNMQGFSIDETAHGVMTVAAFKRLLAALPPEGRA